MANEVKKLMEWGIDTPQTRYLIMKEKTALKWGDEYHVVDHSEPRMKPKWSNDLRVDETGQIVQAPLAPEPIDQTGWKRITEKRQAMLDQYEEDLANYEVAMAKWLELPFLNDDRSVEEHRREFLMSRPKMGEGITHRTFYDYMNGVFDPEIPVLVYWVKGFGEVRMTAFPVVSTGLEVIECDPTNNYWTQQGFEGNASRERRRYKRNRSIPKEDWADTDIETGEQLQRTLFNFREVQGYNPSPRVVVNFELFESFETKPNSYLSKAYLEYLLNGTELSDWQKFQLNKRMTKKVIGREGQQTLL